MRESTLKEAKKNWQLYLLLLIPVTYILVFAYYPMLGAQIAFKNFNITKGIWGSPWVGFKHFQRFIQSYQFVSVLKNTLGLSLYGLIAGFPFSILLALALNYVGHKNYKRIVQTVSYAPHFISTVVMVGMLMEFLNPRNGLIKNFLAIFGINFTSNVMGVPGAFSSIYVWSGVWQGIGFGSIIYLAVLSGIDPSLHEAAIVDGASKKQRLWFIDLPSLMPTAIILLIMNLGNILNVGFEKALLMQNPMNISTSEIIDTYVYKVGLTSSLPDFAYSTAIGLFKSFIAFILIVLVNKIAKRLGETSLW